MLHRITEPGGDGMYPGFRVSTDWLDRAIRCAIDAGWEPIGIDDVPACIARANRNRRFVCFTCDDGYADNFTIGLPVFQRHGVPVCVYVTTGMLERTTFYWWGALEELVYKHRLIEVTLPELGTMTFHTRTPSEKTIAFVFLDSWANRHFDVRDRVLTALFARYGVDATSCLDRDILTVSQLQRFAADPLVTIGSHGETHRPLSGLPEQELRRELEISRDVLQAVIGTPVTHIAYPFGHRDACGEREFNAARLAGFLTGVTTVKGNLFPRDTLLSLPRRAPRPSLGPIRGALYNLPEWLRT